MASVSAAAQFDPAERDSFAGLAEHPLHIPANAHTLDGFRTWVLSDQFPEKLRALYLRGEVWLDMSKEEIRTHAAVKTAIAGTMFNLNEEVDFGDLYINGVLVTNKRAKVSNNPDMVAVFWQSLEAGRVRYEQRRKEEVEIVGSPDWLLEIVSKGSVVKDRKQLKQAYHDAKVREYWIVDARGDEIDFRVLHWRPRGYQLGKSADGWHYSHAFARRFRLLRTVDRRGAWRYRLETKKT